MAIIIVGGNNHGKDGLEKHNKQDYISRSNVRFTFGAWRDPGRDCNKNEEEKL